MADHESVIAIDLKLVAGSISSGNIDKKAFAEINNIEKAISKAILHVNPNVEIDAVIDDKKVKVSVSSMLSKLTSDLKDTKSEIGTEYRKFFDDSLRTIRALQSKFSSASIEAFRTGASGDSVAHIEKQVIEESHRVAAAIELAADNVKRAIISAGNIYKFAGEDGKRPPSLYFESALAEITAIKKSIGKFRGQANMPAVDREARAAYFRQFILDNTDFSDLKSNPNDLRRLQRVLRGELKAKTDKFKLEPDDQNLDEQISDLQGKLKLTGTALSKISGNSLAKSYTEAVSLANKYLADYSMQRLVGDKTDEDVSTRLFALEGAKGSIRRAIGQAKLAGSKGKNNALDISRVDALRAELDSVDKAITELRSVPVVKKMQEELTSAKGLFEEQKTVYSKSVYGSKDRALAFSDLRKTSATIASLETKLSVSAKERSDAELQIRNLQTATMQGDLARAKEEMSSLTARLGTSDRRKGDIRKARDLASKISSIERFLGLESSDPKKSVDAYLEKVSDSQARSRLREKALKPDYYMEQVTGLRGGRSPKDLTDAERKAITAGYASAVSKAKSHVDSLIGKRGFSAAKVQLDTAETSQREWLGALESFKAQGTALKLARKRLVEVLKSVAKTRTPAEILKSLDGFQADWKDVEGTLDRISTATSLLRSAQSQAIGTGQGSLATGIAAKLRELRELRKNIESSVRERAKIDAQNRHLAILGKSPEDSKPFDDMRSYYQSGTSGLEARSRMLDRAEQSYDFERRLRDLRSQAAAAAQARRPADALALKALNREQINPLRKALGDLRKEFAGLVPDSALDRLYLVHRALDKVQERAKKHLKPITVAATGTLAPTDQQARTSLLYGIGKGAYDAAGGSISQLHPTDHKAVSVFLAEERKAIDARQAAIAQNASLNDREKRRQAREAEADYDRLVRAQAELNATMRGNIGLWRQMSVAAKAFFRYAVLYGGAYSLISYFQRLTTTVIDFQDALKGIQVIAKATDEDMGSIGASIRDVSSSTGASLREVASAAETLAQAGVVAKDIPAALKAVSDFALATGSQLQVASDIITSAREIFGDGTTFSGSADQLTKAVNISKLKAEDLRTLFNLGAQTAQASGLTQAQFLGTSATLSNLGIKSSTVATGVRQLLLELFNPDEKTLTFLRSQYNKLGENLTDSQITSLFRSFQTAANPLIAALTELRRLGAGGVAQDEFRRVLDIRAENVALPLLRRLDELAANTAQIGSVGAASDGAADRVETLRKSLDALAVKAQLAAEAFSGPFMKGLKVMADSAGTFLDDIMKGGERLRRAGSGSEVDTETALSGGVIGWALARRFGFGKVGQAATAVGGAIGAEGAVAAGQAADNARSDSKGTIANAINWLLSTFGLLSLIGGLSKGKAALEVGQAAGVSKAVEWLSKFIVGMKTLSAGRELAALTALGRLGVLLSSFSVVTVLAGLAAKVYRDIYDFQTQFLSSGSSSEDRAGAFDTLLAEQNRKVEALAEQRKAFDPNIRGSAQSDAQAIKDSLERYRATLSEMFGAEAESARRVFEELGSVAIEGGTPTAERAKAELQRILGRSFSEADFSRLVRAQSDFVAGEQALYGKARAIAARAGELMSKSKDQLTATEREFLATYNRLQNSPLFKPGTLNPAELGQAVTDLFELIRVQTDSLTEEYRAEAARRSALQFNREQPQFEDAYFKAESNTVRERLNQRVREIGLNPTREGLQFLDDYRSTLNSMRQRPDVRADAAKLRVIEATIDDLNRKIEEVSRLLDQQQTNRDAQTTADNNAARAREERVAQAQEEVRVEEERYVRLVQERNENLQRELDLDQKIANAKEQHEWQKLLGPNGLLQQKYEYERKALTAEKNLAAAKLRKAAAERGIDLPSGVGEITPDKAVLLSRDPDTTTAYEKYEETKRKLIEAANTYNNTRQHVTQEAHRKIAFTQTPEYGRRQRRIEEIETELGDSVRDSAEEIKAKYAELYELEAKNIDDQIQHLKSQRDTYKADEGPKYQADLEELEDKKRKLKVSIEKKIGTALREINTREAEREIQSIQQRIKRNQDRITTLSNSQGTVRNLTRTVTNQPPASSSNRVRTSQVGPNPQWWYNQLLNDPELNLTPEDAAAIVGNLMWESTPSMPPTKTNSIGAYGAAQWLDSRKTKLFKRPGYDTKEGQYAYLKDELLARNGAEDNSKALRALRSAPDLYGKVHAWRTIYERPGEEEANDAGRFGHAKSVLGVSTSPESAEIVRLSQENTDLNRQLAEAERRKATSQPGGLTPEAEAATLEQALTRQYENALKGVQALLDSQRSSNDTQQYQVEMATAMGLPEGPSYTAARETAGMSPATADSYGRLVRISDAMLEAKNVADQVLEEALAFRDYTKAHLQGLEEQRKTATERGLTQQQTAELDNEIKTAADSLKQWDSGVREFAQRANLAATNLAQTRQEMQGYRPTLTGEKYTTKEIGPDGNPVEKVVKVYGQLDQIDFASIEGDLNKLNYAFSRLGANMRDFAVRVIDTFVTKLAESIVNGFENVDTTALQQAQTDLREAQAEAAYQRAVKTEQIKQLDQTLSGGRIEDRDILKRRKEALEQALQDSNAAQDAKVRAAAERAKAEQEALQNESGMAGAFQGLMKEGATSVLKTAILTPIQSVFKGLLGGGRDGSSAKSALFVEVVNGAGGVAGSVASGAKDAVDWLSKSANTIGEWGSAIAGVFGFAGGGMVHGPGTGTSDSIPAWLSSGEYVLTAQEVRAIGVQNLDRWKTAMMTPAKFAQGGLVDTMRATSSAAASPFQGGPSTSISVIDQRSAATSSPIEVTKSKGPGDREIIQMLVKDAVKTLHNSGALDRTMAMNHGARRPGARR